MVFLTVACSIFLSGGTSPNPTIKGRNAARSSPKKNFRIVYTFLSDAEIRCSYCTTISKRTLMFAFAAAE
jgi:hypothetical protein